MGKLDSFVSRQPLRDIRVPELPSPQALVKDHGLMGGLARFGEALERWRRDLEIMLRQVAPEEPAPAATVETTVADTSAADSAAASIAAHAALIAAHGATGEVVGTENTQDLERKNLGQTNPGYGRFAPLISRNNVPPDGVWNVPAGWNMIVPSGFTVDGELTVNGMVIVVE